MSKCNKAFTSESASKALITRGSLVFVSIKEFIGAASLIVPVYISCKKWGALSFLSRMWIITLHVALALACNCRK